MEHRLEWRLEEAQLISLCKIEIGEWVSTSIGDSLRIEVVRKVLAGGWVVQGMR
jgi:hypothetical protein